MAPPMSPRGKSTDRRLSDPKEPCQGKRRQPERGGRPVLDLADLTPVPALPVAGAIALAVLLLLGGGVRRRAAS